MQRYPQMWCQEPHQWLRWTELRCCSLLEVPAAAVPPTTAGPRRGSPDPRQLLPWAPQEDAGWVSNISSRSLQRYLLEATVRRCLMRPACEGGGFGPCRHQRRPMGSLWPFPLFRQTRFYQTNSFRRDLSLVNAIPFKDSKPNQPRLISASLGWRRKHPTLIQGQTEKHGHMNWQWLGPDVSSLIGFGFACRCHREQKLVWKRVEFSIFNAAVI